jgi:hypothetical protein
MGKKFCGLGQCSQKYIYILITALLFLFKTAVLGLTEFYYRFPNYNMFKVETVIIGHPLLKLLLEYLGYVIYGAIFILVLKKNKIFRKDESETNSEKNILIYHEKILTKGNTKLLLIACGSFAVQLIVRSILNSFGLWKLDLWVFNIIFITYFLKLTFKYRIYKHQLYSLGFNFGINIILLISASCISSGDNPSDYESVKNHFGSYFYILLFYLVFLILSACISFSQVMQKKLMDFYYISPINILFVIGIISAIFTLLALIISTNVNCGEYIEGSACGIHYKDNLNSSYFDNYNVYISNLGDHYEKSKKDFYLEIFLVYPLYSFACYLKYLFETLIVYHLNPNYVLISDNIYYSIKITIALIHEPKDIKTYLNLLGDIISLFAYFFYLEIFKINRFGLSYDTRLSIFKRSELEIDNCEEIDDNEDDDLLDNDKRENKETDEEKKKKQKENEMLYLEDKDDMSN